MIGTKQIRQPLRWVLVGQAMLMLGGCGSKSQPNAVRRPAPLCQLVDVREAPLGVRIINRSMDSVTIFTDICRGHHRVGDVTAGNTRMFAFPRDLVLWSGGVRLLIYRNGSLENFNVQVLRLERRLFEIEIPKEAPPSCRRELYVNGEKVDGSEPPVPREQVLRVELFVPADADPNCLPLNIITVTGSEPRQ